MSDVTVPGPQYRDRSVGLIAFGIAQILIGGCALLGMLGIAGTMEISARSGRMQLPAAVIATDIILFGVAAAYFLVIGYGSIRRRRWARAIALIISWMWLIAGTFGLVVVMIVLRQMSGSMAGNGASWGVVAGCGSLMVIVLPLVFVLFYRSPHVKATVDARDPKPRWTDRVPLPVLAVVLIMAFTSLMMLATVSYGKVAFLGVIIDGPPAMVISFGFAVVFAFLAVQLYRLKESAWWTTVLLHAAGAVIAVITMLRTNFDELNASSGIPTAGVSVNEIYHSPLLLTVMGLLWAVYLGFLLSLRKYFAGNSSPRTRRGEELPSV